MKGHPQGLVGDSMGVRPISHPGLTVFAALGLVGHRGWAGDLARMSRRADLDRDERVQRRCHGLCDIWLGEGCSPHGEE